MNKKYKKIWQLSLPYLKQGKMKNFVLHTEGVVKAMELLLKKEKGDSNILIPAAILHDIGWAKVPLKLQKSHKQSEKTQAMRLHLEYAPAIIKKVPEDLNYNSKFIERIAEIVLAHKFHQPRQLDKRLLIDADNLSDAFKEQFYSDVKAYHNTPQNQYNYRLNNKFYTKTAKNIFYKELNQRKKEFLA